MDDKLTLCKRSGKQSDNEEQASSGTTSKAEGNTSGDEFDKQTAIHRDTNMAGMKRTANIAMTRCIPYSSTTHTERQTADRETSGKQRAGRFVSSKHVVARGACS